MADQREFKDIEIKCADCPKTFVFTQGEQRFFDFKGLKAPKRCVDCRLRKKRALNEGYRNEEESSE